MRTSEAWQRYGHRVWNEPTGRLGKAILFFAIGWSAHTILDNLVDPFAFDVLTPLLCAFAAVVVVFEPYRDPRWGEELTDDSSTVPAAALYAARHTKPLSRMRLDELRAEAEACQVAYGDRWTRREIIDALRRTGIRKA